MATQADIDETVAQVEALDRRIIAVDGDVRSQEQLDAVVGGQGGGLAGTAEVRAAVRIDGVHTVRASGQAVASQDAGHAGHRDRGASRLDRVDHLVPGQRPPAAS
jgi:hypothetical protein